MASFIFDKMPPTWRWGFEANITQGWRLPWGQTSHVCFCHIYRRTYFTRNILPRNNHIYKPVWYERWIIKIQLRQTKTSFKQKLRQCWNHLLVAFQWDTKQWSHHTNNVKVWQVKSMLVRRIKKPKLEDSLTENKLNKRNEIK